MNRQTIGNRAAQRRRNIAMLLAVALTGVLTALVLMVARTYMLKTAPIQPPAIGLAATARIRGQAPATEADTAADEREETAESIEVIAASAQLEVSLIQQNPELPNGCEATSLAMVLNYLGYNADKVELSSEYIPSAAVYTYNGVSYGPDLATTYAGNAANNSGYYILAPGLATAANTYLSEAGSTLAAEDISGAGEDELIELLAEGHPVIIWVTMNLGQAEYVAHSWVVAETGALLQPYANLHCVVLTGYDEEYFTIHNPLADAPETIESQTLMDAYEALESQAVVIR